MAYSVSISGEVQASPPSGQAVPAGQYNFPFEVPETYKLVNPIPLDITGVTDLVVALGMTKVKRLYVRITGGDLKLKVSTAIETDQVVRCGRLMILGDPLGEAITGLKLTGTATGEVLACGDE